MPNKSSSLLVFEGPERRLRARFRTRVPFVLKSNGTEVRGTTRNVSLLGISAFMEKSFSPGQSVQCILELPLGMESPVIATGTIIRSESASFAQPEGDQEVGVFFREFQEKGEGILSRYLRQIAREEQETVKKGYKLLRERIAARKKRKRTEMLLKKKRRAERLRRRKQRLARHKKLARERRRKKSQKGRKPSSKKSGAKL